MMLDANAPKAKVLYEAKRMFAKSTESNRIRQGVFSYYLINGLSGYADEDKNGNITIKELFKYVKYMTVKFAQKDNSRQTPVLFGNFDLNLIVGKVSHDIKVKGLEEEKNN